MTTDSLLTKVEASLNTLRPYLAKDGGNVEVVEITKDFVLRIKLTGSCQSCPQNLMTLKAGIEDVVKSAVPEIVAVEAVNISV